MERSWRAYLSFPTSMGCRSPPPSPRRRGASATLNPNIATRWLAPEPIGNPRRTDVKKIIGAQGEITIIQIDALPAMQTKPVERNTKGWIISHSKSGHHHLLTGG